ncbi:MAG: adenine deaminase [Bacteroidia bacterium]|nr:adenine deaminase [Bacteroidia bacterium]MCF8427328.1 adenine deaminase [Bacteroidia bacterium]
MQVEGQVIDILKRRIFPARILVQNGIITAIQEIENAPERYILPGFVDAHVHIESSLLAPSEFARMALTHGTLATISDPHEIANVLGIEGVNYMIENGKQVPFYFHFGAPSCVPATVFETAGATLSPLEVEQLLAQTDINYLTEMMNFPGVLNDDPEVMEKIAAAKKFNKPIDGHAPGLRGEALKKYVSAGISTDHECFTLEEAEEKLSLGMKILIREGSAARNFEALIPLMDEHYKNLMFCSDDKHPDSLILGHINQLVARAIAKGNDLFKVLQVACLNAAEHYSMRQGLLRLGDSADFIVLKDLVNFEVEESFIAGNLVAKNGQALVDSVSVKTLNQFRAEPILALDLAYEPKGEEPVIVCLEGQLITDKILVQTENLTVANDCLKLVVVNRYSHAKPAIAYIKNFGLKLGAMAGSVAHDSHNIIAVGTSDEDLAQVINLVIASKGALAACAGETEKVLPLPLAGLMSDKEAWQVAGKYTELDLFCKTTLGSSLQAPFMSLSFMALLVIPHLKLSDKGLFDGDSFSFIRKN